MFTGLVENTTSVICLKGGTETGSMSQLKVKPLPHVKAAIGDSIAVNGCCLTVTDASDETCWVFDVSRESLARTNLGEVNVDDRVNIERPLMLNTRLDGHLVSGHIDDVATVLKLEESTTGWQLDIAIPRSGSDLVIEKGSICLNGVSLTINELKDHEQYTEISLMLIPTTLEKTNLKNLGAESKVNVEYDIFGKYILRMQDRVTPR